MIIPVGPTSEMSEGCALALEIVAIGSLVGITLIIAWFYIIEPLKERAEREALRRKNMNKSLLTIYKEPGKDPTVKVIDNELKPLQRAVGGYIEVVDYKDGLIILCDEEGYIKGKEPNVFGICGPVVVCRTKGEDFASVGEGEIAKLLKEFSE